MTARRVFLAAIIAAVASAQYGCGTPRQLALADGGDARADHELGLGGFGAGGGDAGAGMGGSADAGLGGGGGGSADAPGDGPAGSDVPKVPDAAVDDGADAPSDLGPESAPDHAPDDVALEHAPDANPIDGPPDAASRPLGAACGDKAQCASGSCVDEKCCARNACDPCQTCTGPNGSCVGVANAPDRDSCTGICDVNGACKAPGSILWARSTSSVFLLGVAETTTGVLATGILNAPADLDGSLLAPAGESDVAIAEYRILDGAYLYSSRVGGSAPAGTGDVVGFLDTADYAGSPLIRGTSTCDPAGMTACERIDLGQGLVAPGGGSGNDGFVGKYSAVSGKASWVARLYGPGDDVFLTSTLGANGSLFVGGYFDQDTTLVSGNDSRAFKAAGDRDILIAELNPVTGQLGMTRAFGGPSFEEPQSMTSTSSHLVVAGTFSGRSVLGTKELNSAGDFDVWVAKLIPADGTPAWAISLGGSGRDVYPFVAADAAGDVYVAGTVDGHVKLGTFDVGGAGGLDIFVAKLRGSDGAVLWATSFGSAGDDGTTDIAINNSGQLLVTGNLAGPLMPGGHAFGADDAFFVSLNSDGVRLWTKVIGTAARDYGFAVASGVDAFYAAINLGADIGTSIEGVPIVGAPRPTGLLLKLEP